jgi:N6-adenosine-specific RNA methylase IME4
VVGGLMETNNELQLRTGPYRTTFVGTEVTRVSTPEEWKNYGEILKRVDEAKQWAIGDWLVDGKSHYADDLYKKAGEILGLDQSILRHYKSLSGRFKLCLRKHNLSWNHHKESASIKKIEIHNDKLKMTDKADTERIQQFLDESEKNKWSVRELRKAVATYKRRQQEEIRLANEPEKFSIILADPAWEYDFSRSSNREIDNHYLPTTLNDMKRLSPPAADDSVLFVWATSPKLEQAFSLINSWGFEYKTCMVWVKDKIGMGYYARQKHELLLIAAKGNLQLPDEDERPDSVFFADRLEHSEKPEIVYELIEQMYPKYKKLEMFARNQREGWQSWGDEI